MLYSSLYASLLHRAGFLIRSLVCQQAARVAWRNDSLRSSSTSNPALQAGALGWHNMSRHGEAEAALGADVLIDTLLLARSSFLLKSISSVSDFSMLFNPDLIEHHFDFQTRGQPPPTWRFACRQARSAG